MIRSVSKQSEEDVHYAAVIAELSAISPEFEAIATDLKSVSYSALKSAHDYSIKYNRPATPQGATAFYLHTSKVKVKGKGGVVAQRDKYYTRGLNDAEVKQLEKIKQVSGRIDYLERAESKKRAKKEDVELVHSNMGETREQRHVSGLLLEGAEKSVKQGGKRRSQLSRAVIMDSLIIELPYEISTAGREQITREVCKHFSDPEVFYLAVAHRPPAEGDQRNYHLHLIFSRRPFTRDATGAVVFSDKVDRALQGPPFLKKLRQVTTAASNRALAREGHGRRLFAGTYAQNGLPFVQSGEHLGVKVHQRRRKERTAKKDDAIGQISTAFENGSWIEVLRAIVEAVEGRLKRQRDEQEAAKALSQARERQLALIGNTMQSLLDQGYLFAFDRGAKKLHLARTTRDAFWGFDPIDGPQRDRRPGDGQRASLGDVFSAMGGRLQEWLEKNGHVLMKAWAKVPHLAIKALTARGGAITFLPSGSISIRVKDKKWSENPLLSWMADAIRNHANDEITEHLTGVKPKKLGQKSGTAATAKPLDVLSTYAKSLTAAESIGAIELGNLRRAVAKTSNIRLALDQIPKVDEIVEKHLHDWDNAAYLVQEHRKAFTSAPAMSATGLGLQLEHDQYKTALNAVEFAAIEPSRPLRDPISQLLKSAVAAFGESLWKERLEEDLSHMFERIKKQPRERVVDTLETSHVTLPSGRAVPRQELALLGQQALAATKRSEHEERIGEARQFSERSRGRQQ